MKYEYKVVEITWNGKHGVIEDTLNEFGAQGWRAAEFRWHSGSHEWVHVLFERVSARLGYPIDEASEARRAAILAMCPPGDQARFVGSPWPTLNSRMIADPESGWSDETQYHPVDSSDA